MERSYLQTIGLPIMTNHGHMAGRVLDVVIRPEDGKIVGFLVSARGKKVVAPIDILSWDAVITIHDEEDIIEIEDVLQVKTALEKNIGIIKKKVVTSGGDYLGKVIDFGMDNKFFNISNLLVAKVIFGFIYTSRIIVSAKDIVEIKKDEIIVKNRLEPMKMKKLRVDMAAQA